MSKITNDGLSSA